MKVHCSGQYVYKSTQRHIFWQETLFNAHFLAAILLVVECASATPPLAHPLSAIRFWSPYSCQRLESFPPQASFPVPLAPRHECSRKTLKHKDLSVTYTTYIPVYVHIRADTIGYVQIHTRYIHIRAGYIQYIHTYHPSHVQNYT